MAISIETIVNETKTVRIEYGANDLNIVYKPNVFTPEFEEEQAKMQSGEIQGNSVIRMLVEMLDDWDLFHQVIKKDDDGKPLLDDKGNAIMVEEKVPITNEGMKKVPLKVLVDIVRMITNDLIPGEMSSGNSEGTF